MIISQNELLGTSWVYKYSAFSNEIINVFVSKNTL